MHRPHHLKSMMKYTDAYVYASEFCCGCIRKEVAIIMHMHSIRAKS